jgi:hypothetical protein
MQTANKSQSNLAVKDGFILANPLCTQKRIGSTVYEIEVYVKKDTAETIDEKIMRLLRNDLNVIPNNDKIIMPQTSWLQTHKCVERSSA